MKSDNRIRSLTAAALFMAMGLVLPLLTGQIPGIGNMLLPMHIPVLLCGLICGWQYGGLVGFLLPLLRHMLFQAPPMPNAVSMAFELAAYGLVIGLLYSRSKSVLSLYRSMLIAMLAGRAVWGIAQTVIWGLGQAAFSLPMFLTGAFIQAVPGIALQLVLIPAVMIALDRTGLVTFDKNCTAEKGAA